MSEELKPCPFCGGSDLRFAWSCRESVTSDHPKDWYQFSSLIDCRGCALQKQFGSFIDPDKGRAKRGAYGIALKEWNTRAALNAGQGEVAPDQADNIQHLTNCADDACERCENLMYFYQACDECGTWGHNDAGQCPCVATPATTGQGQGEAVALSSFDRYRLAAEFAEQRGVVEKSTNRAIVVDAFASGYGFGIAAQPAPGFNVPRELLERLVDADFTYGAHGMKTSGFPILAELRALLARQEVKS